MKREVCGEEFVQLESSLVCPNGHTIQNTLEVMDDDVRYSVGRLRKIRVKAQETAVDRSYEPVSSMLIMTVLFREAMKALGIASDAALRYFTGYFRLVGPEEGETPSRKKSIEGDEVLTVYTLLALIYISRRSETERAGRTYPISVFNEEVARFDLNYRALEAARRHKIGKWVLQKMGFPVVKWRAMEVEQRMEELVDFDMFITHRVERGAVHSTGVIPLRIEKIKGNFRALLPHSLPLYEQYFRDLCGELGVEQSERLLFYWRKFVYTVNPHRVFVPEARFSLFIAQYAVNEGTFGVPGLERRILEYLGTSGLTLRIVLGYMTTRLNHCIDPGRFLKLLDSEYRDRYRNLSMAVWMIRAFKRYLGEDG